MIKQFMIFLAILLIIFIILILLLPLFFTNNSILPTYLNSINNGYVLIVGLFFLFIGDIYYLIRSVKR
jgi:hypothetical protein